MDVSWIQGVSPSPSPSEALLVFLFWSTAMLRQASKAARSTAKRPLRSTIQNYGRRTFQTKASSTISNGSHGQRNSRQTATLMISAVLLGGVAAYAGGKQVHNDSAPATKDAELDPALALGSLVKDLESLHSLVWGSNRYVYIDSRSLRFLTVLVQEQAVVTHVASEGYRSFTRGRDLARRCRASRPPVPRDSCSLY